MPLEDNRSALWEPYSYEEMAPYCSAARASPCIEDCLSAFADLWAWANKHVFPQLLTNARSHDMHAVDGVNTLSLNYIWTLAISQLVVLIVQEYICMALDWKYHGVDHFTSWPRDLRRLVAYSFITMTFGGLK